ncbi:MAG: cobyrinate a,c-diamide synthase [Negativibacillus sp.]|nr:cobyrinate a,c-diamide synthase [Negativibacillus sp.]
MTPRLMLAAASSGSGKTTIACAILQALTRMGEHPVSFKCGPDYIDPMFHRQVLGVPSRNLDLFFSDEATAAYLLQKNSENFSLAFIEGVMGYYDGIATTTEASSWQLAKATQTPVVLVLNCKGMSVSIAAQLGGYLSYQPDSQIKGVILNQVSKSIYPEIKALIEQRYDVAVCGYMPKMSDCSLESRHLGLVTAEEIGDLQQRLEKLGEQAMQTIDLPLLLKIAAQAPALAVPAVQLPAPNPTPLRIGVARDKAFSFYYADNLELLEQLGAQLVEFSPLHDPQLPDDLDGLLLGGGYPELYADTLSQNRTLMAQIKAALQNGLPCIAECGGFQYLCEQLEGADSKSYPMVGFLPGSSFRTPSLRRFGYVRLTAQKDNLLCKKGEGFAAHEFHYWDSQHCGNGCIAQKPCRRSSWECVVCDENFWAGYPHLYFYANVQMAKNFLNRCNRFHTQKEGK